MRILFGDTETWCEEPIANGTPKYAETAELLSFTWTFDDEEFIRDWDRTVDPEIPAELLEAAQDPDCIWVFQNAFFDRTVLRLQHPEICPPIERWRCSMVKGMAHTMPGSLEKQGEIMGLAEDQKKLKEGKDLVRLFCCPQPKTYKLRRATRLTHPEKWAKFVEYRKGDVIAMRAIWKKLPSWNYGPTEIALWHLDQRINDRGVYIDLDFVNAAVKASETIKKGLAEETQEQTGFDAETGEGLESTTKRDKMLKYLLAEYGVDLPDLRASTIERRMNDESLPQSLRNLLAIRLEASQTSVTKYKKILRTISKDGRLRGLLQFDAALRTRRWGGRNFQPQNLVRPPKYVAKEWEKTIEIIKQDAVDLFFSKPMEVLGGTIRGVIAAPPGKKLVVADLSNIEGRKGAWYGGEEWKLQAFRDYDTVKGADGKWYTGPEYYGAALRGEIIDLELDVKGDPIRKGPDLYKVSYANAFRVDISEVDEYKRQIGKVMELMLQYEGGVGAFVTGALTYNIDLEKLAEIALPTIPKRIVKEATEFLAWQKKKKRSTLGLSDKVFIVCDSLKRLWREAHPGITAIWKQLKECAIKAITHPGIVVKCGKVNFIKEKAWLKMVLPSGRCLCYPNATVDEDGSIKYKGVNQYSRKWTWIKTYGGKFLENCLAGDTEVLTPNGWKRIDSVGISDLVWDGIEFVTHSGKVFKGFQETIDVFGISMTPDHKVLTTTGWVDASSCEGYNRAYCRLPNSEDILRIRRKEITLERGLCLWKSSHHVCVGVTETKEKRDTSLVRLHAEENDRYSQYCTRYVFSSRLRSVSVDDRSVSAANASGVEKLRGAWHNCLRTLASGFRCFLERYGADIPKRIYVRTAEQFRWIFGYELCLANNETPRKQPPQEPHITNPERENDVVRSRNLLSDKTIYVKPQNSGGLAPFKSVKPVYDLMNCGPRHRFVVRDRTGGLLIVHNCCQSSARDVMADNMPGIEVAGYDIVLTVHDEVPTEAPQEARYNSVHLSALMVREHEWFKDLPLAAAGWEGPRYKKG